MEQPQNQVDVVKQIEALLNEQRGVYKEMEQRQKALEGRMLTKEALEEFKSGNQKLIDAQLKNDTELAKLWKALGELNEKNARGGSGMPAALKTVGQRVVESEQFKSLGIGTAQERKRGRGTRVQASIGSFFMRSAHGGPSVHVTGVPGAHGVSVEGGPEAGLLAGTSGDVVITGGGYGYVQYLPGYGALPFFPLGLLNLIPRSPTSAITIEFLQQVPGFNNLAGYQPNYGDLKPESNWGGKWAQANVRTIAHWMRVPDQMLDDLPGLIGMLDIQLMRGLKRREEQAVALDDGTNNSILGLVPQIPKYAAGSTKPGDTRLDIILKAITDVAAKGYACSGIAMTMAEWGSIQLMKTSLGTYLVGGPFALTQPTLWGLPVGITTLANFGVIVGDFAGSCQIFDRMQAMVEISYEDQDNFVRNLATILAEERLAFACYTPDAFEYIAPADFVDMPAAGTLGAAPQQHYVAAPTNHEQKEKEKASK